MNIDKAMEIAEKTIVYGIRHSDYEKCCEISEKAEMFVTGEEQDEYYLINLRDKETDRQKEIRIKVTKPITPLALNPVKTEYAKIFRVDGVTSSIEGNDLTDLTEALETYHSNASLENYLERRYVHWNFIDPNGWLITERRNVVDEVGKVEKVDVYPLEVTSEQAINYKYDNGVPQWLIVRHERIEIVTEGKERKPKEVYDYYFYAAGIALRYSQYIETPPEFAGGISIELVIEGTDGATKFMFGAYDTGTVEFPGHKWGAYEDQEGDGTVKVPPFWDGARFLLEDLIETKSVFDVSKHNHVFPKLFHYAERCKHSVGGAQCNNGYIETDETKIKCPACEGTGNSIHFGESDIITFDIPANLEDLSKLPPLDSLAYYHQPPLEVTQALYEWVKEYKEDVYFASFNSTNVKKGQAEKTAYEVFQIYDDINTRVYPSASWLSRIYEKTVRITAQYLEKNDIKVRHSFPLAMKLEPLEVLIQRYKDSEGLPYEVRQSLLLAVLRKAYLDNPTMAENIKAWEYWKPFKSMSQETVLFILQDRANDDFDKQLFQNWDKVQIEVERKLGDVNFSSLTPERQYAAIKEALAIVTAEITYLDSGLAMPDLTQQDPLTTQDPNQIA